MASKPGMVAHDLNPSTLDAETGELEASLIYISKLQDIQGYMEGPCLGGEGGRVKEEEEEDQGVEK